MRMAHATCCHAILPSNPKPVATFVAPLPPRMQGMMDTVLNLGLNDEVRNRLSSRVSTVWQPCPRSCIRSGSCTASTCIPTVG